MKAAVLFALAAVLSGCGYHVAGHSTVLPKNIKTIAIPAFANNTTRYKLASHLAGALSREFLTRTRYQVVPDPRTADVVLEGSLVLYNSYPVVFDPVSGRASGVIISVVMNIAVRDRASKAILFARQGLEAKERYEISVDQLAYFEESDTAAERLSRDVARGVVSAILESF